MANTSLQIVEVPDFIEESSEYDIKYKRTAKWDAIPALPIQMT